MKKHTLKPIVAALGTTFVVSLAMGPVQAAENPFAMNQLSSGYMVAEEGTCGEGKKAEGTCGEGKKAEGTCGEGKKAEGHCGEEKGEHEGACGGMKEGEGSCGEGK